VIHVYYSKIDTYFILMVSNSLDFQDHSEVVIRKIIYLFEFHTYASLALRAH